MPAEQPNAPAPAAAQPAAPTAPPDQLVEVKVDGKTYMEPVSKLRESYQIQSAAQKRLEQANALRSQHQEAVTFYEGLQDAVARDPEGAVERIRKFAEERAGRPLRAATKNTSVEIPDGLEEMSPHNKATLERLQAVETELNTVRRHTSADRVQREVQAVLSTYPIYDQNHGSYDEDARAQAELVLLASAEKFPGRPLDEIAAATHTRHANMLARALTRTRDHRDEAARNNAGVPPSQGTPATAERQKFSRADIKNGRAQAAIEAMQKRGGGLLRAMFPNG